GGFEDRAGAELAERVGDEPGGQLTGNEPGDGDTVGTQPLVQGGLVGDEPTGLGEREAAVERTDGAVPPVVEACGAGQGQGPVLGDPVEGFVAQSGAAGF